MVTAFQANAFQSAPLAFQIDTGPAPPPPPPFEEIGGGGIGHPDYEFQRQLQRSTDEREAKRLSEDAALRKVIARAYGIIADEEPAVVPDMEDVAALALSEANQAGILASEQAIRDILVRYQAMIAADEAETEDQIMTLLLMAVN